MRTKHVIGGVVAVTAVAGLYYWWSRREEPQAVAVSTLAFNPVSKGLSKIAASQSTVPLADDLGPKGAAGAIGLAGIMGATPYLMHGSTY